MKTLCTQLGVCRGIVGLLVTAAATACSGRKESALPATTATTESTATSATDTPIPPTASPYDADRHAFNFWGAVCGSLLSRAHSRSGDVARIEGYCGDDDTLDRALADFAEAYGDQTERDHAELVQAIKSGRVKAAGE